MLKRKLITFITVFGLLFSQVGPALAQEIPTAPTPPPAPTAPSAPTPPPAPDAPTPPPNPFTNPTPTPTPTSVPTPSPTSQTSNLPSPDPSPSPVAPAVIDGTGGQNTDGQLGGSTVNTGDATTTAVLATDANSNLAGVLAGSGGGASIVNSGNGTDSQNSGSATISDQQNTFQDNSAHVTNDLNQGAVSGANSASSNTGGDASITTGDANVSGTLITAVNTNMAGVAVSEFNIADNQTGDYVLDFAANCIVGCGSGSTSVANTGNGANSNNLANATQVIDTGTFQTNDAAIDNSMTLAANSGDNRADRNTGGDSTITTGDANVSANALTLANNNLAGQILYGVVNIYGELVGDIIFPEELLSGCCAGSTSVANTGNGADSTNTAGANLSTANTTVQTNVAEINNNLNLDAISGDNSTSRNTDGNNSITTGNTSVDAQVLNIANSNIAGGVWWLVLVNEAGQWVGRIMGAPDGANFAGSSGSEFSVNDAGEITVVNSGNGAGSQNQAAVDQSQSNTTIQTNTLALNNNLNLSANTGGNSASRNTGGNSSVTTGDAQIMANLVNFVNNNISSGGKLVVTVVNVFGSWLGNFVGPGQHKAPPVAAEQVAAVGGAEVTTDSAPTPARSATPSVAGGPTPTPTPHAGVSVLASLTGGGGGFGGGSEIKIAGYSTSGVAGSLVQATNGKKTLRINLAWLLIFVPAGGIFLLIRKKLLARAAH